jgi:hypothetical protein
MTRPMTASKETTIDRSLNAFTGTLPLDDTDGGNRVINADTSLHFHPTWHGLMNEDIKSEIT